MKTTFSAADLSGSVIAVPPLCRDGGGRLDVEANRRLVRHLEHGGVRTLLYGGNANIYNLAPGEFGSLLDMLEEIAGGDTAVIPALGPHFGTAWEQAQALRERAFPTAMLLPTTAASTAEGVRRAVPLLAERLGRPLVLYMKDEGYITAALAGEMVAEGVVCWIKYAVVRENPEMDPLLAELCQRVDPRLIVSGIGEQPAAAHWRHHGLRGFTTGCGCVAPRLSMRLLAALARGDWAEAEALRQVFVPLEALRNAWGPIRVLHEAVDLCGIASTGEIQPLLAPLPPEVREKTAEAARRLREADAA